MGEVEDLYKQLQQLRSYLPGLMQLLATFGDDETNKHVFHEVARSVQKWRTAAVAFDHKYAELKGSGVLSGPVKNEMPSPEMRTDFDYGFDNNFGVDGLQDDYKMGSDMLDDGIGGDFDEFLDI